MLSVHVIDHIALDEVIEFPSMPISGASFLGLAKEPKLGGKGANQAMIMGRAGVKTSFVSAIGKDWRAKLIRSRLESEPLDVHLIPFCGHRSDFSVIFNTDGENAIITTNDRAESMFPAAAIKTLPLADADDLVILQGNLNETTTRHILEQTRQRYLMNIFNPSPSGTYFMNLWHHIDMVFMNQSEAEYLSDPSSIRQSTRYSNTVFARLSSPWATGARSLLPKMTTLILFRPTSPILCTSGACDRFMATAPASAALRSVTLDARALAYASQAAALTVSRHDPHSAFPTTNELCTILTE